MESAKKPVGALVIGGDYQGLGIARSLGRRNIPVCVIDDEISIGDFVVSGGELPAMLIADAVGRLVEGVVGNADSVVADSFYDGILDHPHYTRPEEIRGKRVPEILISGHHENIRRWRKEQALRETLKKRPDLLKTAELDDEAREILRRIENES